MYKALLLFSLISLPVFANSSMMEIVSTDFVDREAVYEVIYTDKIVEIKPAIATLDNKDYPYLSLKGVAGETCRITQPVAESYGFSLGEMALFLQSGNIYIKCTENFKNSFVFNIEITKHL